MEYYDEIDFFLNIWKLINALIIGKILKFKFKFKFKWKSLLNIKLLIFVFT